MKKQVLFVDDDRSVLAGFQRMLDTQTEVWDMTFASSADEALDATTKSDLDVIVADVRMPGKDGFELLKLLQETERTRDIPVVIVTGVLENGYKRRALDLGASDLLSKPVDAEDLVARLQSVLRLKSYQDELKAQKQTLAEKVKQRTMELEESRLDIIWRLAKAAEFRDKDTGNHVVRVGWYCRPIAEALGLERDFVDMLFLASPLHDIGKIGIPDHILFKPGILEPEEWEIMKTHCAIGAEILQSNSELMQTFRAWSKRPAHSSQEPGNPILRMASSIALTHHEKWDGTGYPHGLVGEQIPLESRIVALADVYDALGSDRPYHRARLEDKVMRMIQELVGSHFDPAVYAAFEKSMKEIRSIQKEFSDKVNASDEADE